MGKQLKYFMWGYQDHFRFILDFEAKQIFARLHPYLVPEIQLVGFLTEDKEGCHPICVSPDEARYGPDQFAEVIKTAKHYQETDPESRIYVMDDNMRELEKLKLKYRAIHRAVINALHFPSVVDKACFFCSWPVKVNDYLVLVILKFPRFHFDQFYRLKKEYAREAPYFHVRLQQSLLDATIAAIFNAAQSELSKVVPCFNSMKVIEDQDQVLRASAKDLMYTPGHAGGNDHGLHGMYEACCTISTLPYEGEEGVGSIVFANKSHQAIEIEVQLKKPVLLSDYGAVRKLLQLCHGSLSLLCDSYAVYGLGRVTTVYNPLKEDVFQVTFTRQFTWQLHHAGQILMHVRYGVPSLRMPGFPDAAFRLAIRKVFGTIEDEQGKLLMRLASSLVDLTHGGMLVIASNADTESARLTKQATEVQKRKLTPDLLEKVSRIDGSVMVDLDGKCHAIGVILDGEASSKCLSSRGSRYNSAIRYVERNPSSVAVIKSEDGMVTVLPETPRQVRRKEIGDALNRLDSLAGEESLHPSELYNAMNGIRGLVFYLNQRECDQVNTQRKLCETKYTTDDHNNAYTDIAPDNDMHEGFYID